MEDEKVYNYSKGKYRNETSPIFEDSVLGLNGGNHLGEFVEKFGGDLGRIALSNWISSRGEYIREFGLPKL